VVFDSSLARNPPARDQTHVEGSNLESASNPILPESILLALGRAMEPDHRIRQHLDWNLSEDDLAVDPQRKRVGTVSRARRSPKNVLSHLARPA